jgi:N-acetylglucosamine malate deacetylase 1
MKDYQNVLVLAPHTDDAELGCGGTVVRAVEERKKVHIAVFSTAEESLPPGFAPDALKNEFFEAIKVLGLDSSNTFVYDHVVRKLSYHRQEVLDQLIFLRERLKPDLVLIPSGSDVHQDHQVLHQEGVRAFKHTTIWGYELPWNQVVFSATGFVRLSERHISKKCEALMKYKSQLAIGRPYFSEGFVRSLATLRGVQIIDKYAEAFEVIRVIG